MSVTTSAAPEPAPDPQAGVIAFLEDRGALAPGECPTRIDTHAARIFLTCNRAWKLKRAVKLPYLDFSTVALRHAALERELELNRRSAPELYLGVRAIRRTKAGSLALEGDGQPVDWLLEMRRFPDDALLADHALKSGIDDDLVLRLADTIRNFHDDAAPLCTGSGVARIEAVIAGNLTSLNRYPLLLAPALVREIIDMQRERTLRHAALLDHRARSGRVRHAHGDLHLGNIALVDGRPLLFDCLEFDTELATIDVLYDLAFLAMDLWKQDLPAAANQLLNRYLDRSPDDEPGFALLPLFLSLRATIRAHALAAQAAEDKMSLLAHDAEGYLELARAFLRAAPARLVAVGGLSGTGKSSVARRLGHLIGAPPGARILRSDVLRKRLAGAPPERPLDPAWYSPRASHAVYAEMVRLARDAMQAGQSVLCDAVFARGSERDALERLAKDCAAAFTGVFLDAPAALRQERIGQRRNDASDADLTVARAQENYAIGPLGCWHKFTATGTIDEIAAEVASSLLQA